MTRVAVSTVQHTELLKRVEAASGPDQEIDCLLAVALDGFFEIEPKWDGGPIGYGYVNDDGTRIEPGHGGAQLVHRYTASIDAALALVERVLPKLCPGVSQNVFHGTWSAWLGDQREGAAFIIAEGNHDTSPSLAILAAILKAEGQTP